MPLTTLLTGSSGFVGATVLAQLIQHGHVVVAIVRSTSSADRILSTHPGWAKHVTFEVVPDFTKPNVFDSVFKKYSEIDYVIHVAAPLLDDPKNIDFVENFEKPSILGNIGLLKSAKAYSKIKSIAITGSINAITLGNPEDVGNRVLGNDQWLPLDRTNAIEAQNSYVRSPLRPYHLFWALTGVENLGLLLRR
jgi:nucleoside-diphosphate-sugar epimerase